MSGKAPGICPSPFKTYQYQELYGVPNEQSVEVALNHLHKQRSGIFSESNVCYYGPKWYIPRSVLGDPIQFTSDKDTEDSTKAPDDNELREVVQQARHSQPEMELLLRDYLQQREAREAAKELADKIDAYRQQIEGLRGPLGQLDSLREEIRKTLSDLARELKEAARIKASREIDNLPLTISIPLAIVGSATVFGIVTGFFNDAYRSYMDLRGGNNSPYYKRHYYETLQGRINFSGVELCGEFADEAKKSPHPLEEEAKQQKWNGWKWIGASYILAVLAESTARYFYRSSKTTQLKSNLARIASKINTSKGMPKTWAELANIHDQIPIENLEILLDELKEQRDNLAKRLEAARTEKNTIMAKNDGAILIETQELENKSHLDLFWESLHLHPTEVIILGIAFGVMQDRFRHFYEARLRFHKWVENNAKQLRTQAENNATTVIDGKVLSGELNLCEGDESRQEAYRNLIRQQRNGDRIGRPAVEAAIAQYDREFGIQAAKEFLALHSFKRRFGLNPSQGRQSQAVDILRRVSLAPDISKEYFHAEIRRALGLGSWMRREYFLRNHKVQGIIEAPITSTITHPTLRKEAFDWSLHLETPKTLADRIYYIEQHGENEYQLMELTRFIQYKGWETQIDLALAHILAEDTAEYDEVNSFEATTKFKHLEALLARNDGPYYQAALASLRQEHFHYTLTLWDMFSTRDVAFIALLSYGAAGLSAFVAGPTLAAEQGAARLLAIKSDLSLPVIAPQRSTARLLATENNINLSALRPSTPQQSILYQ